MAQSLSQHDQPRAGHPVVDSVCVTAPARLHFGLFSFGRKEGRNYGGVGAMIEEPALQLRVRPGRELTCRGPLADRAKEFAVRWAKTARHAGSLRCQIEVQRAPPNHTGLGVGTQLALAVAAALNALFGASDRSAEALALRVGRGLRSGVGIYGFRLGGLIFDDGKLPGQKVGSLADRVALPGDWRFVLARPSRGGGMYGEKEEHAFASIPAVADAVTEQLRREAFDVMRPAARQGDFDRFGDSIYRYSRLAGECYASLQGGPYAGPLATEIVSRMRQLGVRGVGQSSWGATIFGLCADDDAAQDLVSQLPTNIAGSPMHYAVSRPNNSGANIKSGVDVRGR